MTKPLKLHIKVYSWTFHCVTCPSCRRRHHHRCKAHSRGLRCTMSLLHQPDGLQWHHSSCSPPTGSQSPPDRMTRWKTGQSQHVSSRLHLHVQRKKQWSRCLSLQRWCLTKRPDSQTGNSYFSKEIQWRNTAAHIQNNPTCICLGPSSTIEVQLNSVCPLCPLWHMFSLPFD